MKNEFYIERTLASNEKTYSETELLTESKWIVVLAEPGAGKSALLKSLARRLNAPVHLANVFKFKNSNNRGKPLVIDAFDELARIDQAGINHLLAKAIETEPTDLIISSRSSEWNNSDSKLFEEFTGQSPLIVRLVDFDESEQKYIYEYHTTRNDFDLFRIELEKFGLEPLIPNPQFLTLLSDAYVESSGHFSDRRTIFSKAVEHLAKEVNLDNRPNLNVSTNSKVNIASEVFCSLLLSGAEGICNNQAFENRSYPFLYSIANNDKAIVESILSTKFFKPDLEPNQHRPIHKIVSEYCSANYLNGQILSHENELTLNTCLTVIAPNNCVREELRGLLGWMAALGNKDIQETIIRLDPYAVLANGDPSQLLSSSKHLLLQELQKFEESDPYFRRNDINRSFSTFGFFSKDIVEEVTSVLKNSDDNSEVRNLLLELISSSNSSHNFEVPLRDIAQNSDMPEHTRMLAIDCLVKKESWKHKDIFKILTDEASLSSLKVAAQLFENIPLEDIATIQIEDYLIACANLYCGGMARRKHSGIERYFLKRVFRLFSLSLTVDLLNSLTRSLTCTCEKEEYECHCKHGMSKIIGHLLDHFFTLAQPPFDASVILGWIEKLVFEDSYNVENQQSVKVLRKDLKLRHEIFELYFGRLNSADEISKAKFFGFNGRYSHAGLALNIDDYEHIINFAFRTDNTHLWSAFMPYHFHHDIENRGPIKLRKRMRHQASLKPIFMKIWASTQKVRKQERKLDKREKYRRFDKRRENQRLITNAKNIKFLQENKDIVANGKHWGCLVRFAELSLNKPEEIKQEFRDETVVKAALKNCHDFLEPNIPDLEELAALQCESKGLYVETILLASCLEIFRACGSLKSVKPKILFAVRTNLSMHFSALEEGEKDLLRNEIDRLIFPTENDAEKFLRDYLEPQLLNHQCKNPEVGLLKYDDVFLSLGPKLALEWLKNSNHINYSAQNELFNLLVNSGEIDAIANLIESKCSYFMEKEVDNIDIEDFEDKQRFWFFRAFYFLSLSSAEQYWNKIKKDKNSVFLFDSYSGIWNRDDHKNWPKLSAVKIEAILNAFFNQWPKVYLPSQYGTGSPDGERAYRFLTEIIWSISSDISNEAVQVISRLLNSIQYSDLHRPLKGIKADLLKKLALKDYSPPLPDEIKELINNNVVISVEGLRKTILHELNTYQNEIQGGEFNSANRFYSFYDGNARRLDETTCMEIIAERLSLKLEAKDVAIALEHQTKNQNRIDITATKMIKGKRRLLVLEGKGQWHKDLFTAAVAQLYERYSIHPAAEHQGIYLVIWFGKEEKVANRINHNFGSPIELKKELEEKLPQELQGLIDIFVLDVSHTAKSI